MLEGAGPLVQTPRAVRAARDTHLELSWRQLAELLLLPVVCFCTMWARAVLCAALLSALCPAGRTEAERDEREVQDYRQNSNRLLGALHDVLEKLQTKRINPWEKKYGQVPSCDLGEHCAIRKGSRIGKMCDCPPGAFCNFFLLKCL
ncbi:cocaine- and amphetamine-regulated transcript 2 [Mastacembelus armatus]|uniref:Cocaine- and amphetamine-regulated transcript 2 n=1 Tax=Mastacembelus armatus TaxID=205130 RepID=A0A7N8XVE4_9TELE|nr:cocaine- and amphetamine-regulated transcript protein-like [Mastacembelus armatus]